MRHFCGIFDFCVVLDKILVFEVWVRLPGACSARFFKELDIFHIERSPFYEVYI